MSIKVMTWIWDNAPASGTELLMLLAIADHADDRGRNAWPSRATLARKTRLDERTVRRVTKRLEDSGQVVVERGSGRSHSNLYTIVMTPAQPVDNPIESGEEREADYPPGDSPRGNVPSERGPPCPERRVTAPPEPSRTAQEPSSSPTSDRAFTSTGDFANDDGGIDHRAIKVLSRLGPHWSLTSKQRHMLSRPAAHALQRGWSIDNLAAYLSANPEGVRSPAAVLSARLNNLPDPPQGAANGTQRPAWCGQCDEPTRHLELPDGRPTRCPDCHPLRTQSTGTSA